MLPHHGHDSNIIPRFGKSIPDSLSLYFLKENEVPSSECILKIKDCKSRFFESNTNDWTGGFLLIGDDKDLAHPNDDHYSASNEQRYYIFNGFHRIMAYFLRIQELGEFKSLYLYYAGSKKIDY